MPFQFSIDLYIIWLTLYLSHSNSLILYYEKVANMKKEIDAIRAKDIAQGGLTQGQQTQIARNEQRISQVMLFFFRLSGLS